MSMTISEAFARARQSGVDLGTEGRRALNMTARSVLGQRVVSEHSLRSAIENAKTTKKKTKKTVVDEVEEDDGEEEEERLADGDDPDDDDEPDDEPAPKPKDKKPLKKQALARALASALAAPGILRERRREERLHAAAMAHVELRMPGASAAVERAHLRECDAVMTEMAVADRGASLGLSAFEMKLCAEQGVTVEAFAFAKSAQSTELLAGNACFEAGTGRRIY